jgi:predicted regulator of Ras-like GTPase activity (Roadblock/LC7/MglB family)
MDDLERVLDACRQDAGGRAAAVVGRDGLVIAASLAASDVADPDDAADLPLAGAETTDLFGVADRLLSEAVGSAGAEEVWARSADAAVLARRLQDRSALMLVLPADADAAVASTAVAGRLPELEAALA